MKFASINHAALAAYKAARTFGATDVQAIERAIAAADKWRAENVQPIGYFDASKGILLHLPSTRRFGLWDSRADSDSNIVWNGNSFDDVIEAWKQFAAKGEFCDVTAWNCGVIVTARLMHWMHGNKEKPVDWCPVCEDRVAQPHQHTPEELRRQAETEASIKQYNDAEAAEAMVRVRAYETENPVHPPVFLHAPAGNKRTDGMPASADERHLRRLLAVRVNMPFTYYDDGEASGMDGNIRIDFMRDSVEDIDKSLCALNLARAAQTVHAQSTIEDVPDWMVRRFLAWQIPKDFVPDCGVSFDGRKDDQWNKNKPWPTGTNLLTYDQAKAMLAHVLGKQAAIAPQPAPDLEDSGKSIAELDWTRLLTGQARALDPGHQSAFDRLNGKVIDPYNLAEHIRVSICKLQRYSFLLDHQGSIRKVPGGKWIEWDEAAALCEYEHIEQLVREFSPKAMGSDGLTVPGYYWTRRLRARKNKAAWAVCYVTNVTKVEGTERVGAWHVLVYVPPHVDQRTPGCHRELAEDFQFVGPLTEQRPNF